MTVVDLKAETRAFSRARLRELALDAARDVVLDRGWAAVRMGAIASAVGISRQSLHGEFGTKDELGDALVMRETATFLDGVQARLAEHPGDLAGGVADAAEFMLSATRDDPLLQTILTRTPAIGGDQSLLPLLTTRSRALVESVAATITSHIDEHDVPITRDRLDAAIDGIVRVVLSHVIESGTDPRVVADDVAWIASRMLSDAASVTTPTVVD